MPDSDHRDHSSSPLQKSTAYGDTRMKSSKNKRHRGKMVGAMSRIMLETLRDTTKLSPVPGLTEAASLALGILDLVEKAQGNKEDLRSLAEQCLALVYIIQKSFETFREGDQIPCELQSDLRHVRNTLDPIAEYAQKRANRGFVTRIVMGYHDAEDIKALQRTVDEVLSTFQFKSNIEQRRILYSINTRLNTASTIDTTSIPSPSAVSPSAPTSSPSVSFFQNASISASGPFMVNYISGDQHVYRDSNVEHWSWGYRSTS
ncbi:hypothetical protein VKT23_008678 [Stygiomarasmius scandens]|uniref:NACHT-NTPase and P-loop NTPases N-terminal domain-containing protein n=1 Tax=Marasmiellus scandens TaxID=2682957 RepID=A0ABR1JJE4_9AGAR